jgi:hypothetical protein
MSGYPQFNFPAFELAAKTLRKQGLDVTSPHEYDPPEMQKLAWASPDGKPGSTDHLQTWGQTLARDVELLADKLNAVILLPNWSKSKGARLEVTVAMNCSYPLFEYTVLTDENGVEQEPYLTPISYDLALLSMWQKFKELDPHVYQQAV